MGGSTADPSGRKWTIMVYLAGDNNLETYGEKDLAEMKVADSPAEVAVVAQFDRMSDQVTRRYRLLKGSDLHADCVAELPETDTGDPQALIDFATWAIGAYPAEHYALVLWSHGRGCNDEDIYEIAGRHGLRDRVTRGQVRGITAGRSGRALFRSSLERIVLDAVEHERAILYDDSSADFLDSTELRHAIEGIVRLLGRPLDLLGFDACLMSMLEVYYQLRGLCDVTVGSQEAEPGDGWPYDRVLAPLVMNPDMSPATLARSIVEGYAGFYHEAFPGLSVTQSAINLSAIEGLAVAVDRLAVLLRDAMADQHSPALVFNALRSAQTFTERDFVDLGHFCLLLEQARRGRPIGLAAGEVFSLLSPGGPSLVAEGHSGTRTANARGLSIYLPARDLSPLYSELDFARCSAWDEFLDAFVHPG